MSKKPYKKKQKSALDEYWWLVLILLLFRGKDDKTDKEHSTHRPELTLKNEVKTKEIVKHVFVDVEAVERANDVHLNLSDLNKKYDLGDLYNEKQSKTY
ncbi:hypothetical protein [Tenacibaculum ovolyticum]|uniref:hypothetical protein n=1 Tax=Tenacibaculum ovolyticum TaxID=104270 RepID=UPI0007EC3846|nr:hypothetical protein [Tenacibaculum ovolyticum]